MVRAGARVAEGLYKFNAKERCDKFAESWALQTQHADRAGGATIRAKAVTITGRLEALFGMFGGIEAVKKAPTFAPTTGFSSTFSPESMVYWEIGGASQQWAEFIAPRGTAASMVETSSQRRESKKPSAALVQLRDSIMGPARLDQATKYAKLALVSAS